MLLVRRRHCDRLATLHRREIPFRSSAGTNLTERSSLNTDRDEVRLPMPLAISIPL